MVFSATVGAIVCTAANAGNTFSFGFDGSWPQARGAINLPNSAPKASIYYRVKAVLDPELMRSQVIVDSIGIWVPAATIVNPKAVAGSAVTSNRICGAVFEALH